MLCVKHQTDVGLTLDIHNQALSFIINMDKEIHSLNLNLKVEMSSIIAISSTPVKIIKIVIHCMLSSVLLGRWQLTYRPIKAPECALSI